MHLLDINVWPALSFDSHRFHVQASEWFSRARIESCCFCRMTQQGFLRLATTPQVMAEQTLTLNEAWNAFDSLYNDPRVVFAGEPAGIEPVWRAFTQHRTFSPKVWNDGYLAAFAQVASFELVTFDRGLDRYSGPRVTILS